MRTQKYAEETKHEFWCSVWSVVFRYVRAAVTNVCNRLI